MLLEYTCAANLSLILSTPFRTDVRGGGDERFLTLS